MERQARPTERHVSDILVAAQARDVPNLAWRFAVAVQYLRSALEARQTSRIVELLQEHLAKDPVRLLLEDRAKDDCHSVVRRDDIDGLVLAADGVWRGQESVGHETEYNRKREGDAPVVNCHKVLGRAGCTILVLGCRLAGLLELFLQVKGALEWCSESVPASMQS